MKTRRRERRARYALIIGEDEAAADTVAIKPLREAGEQIAVPARELAARLAAAAGTSSNVTKERAMAVYDLEEQEQLDDLKAWWKRWGNTITGVAIAVCVARASASRAGAGGPASRRKRPRALFGALSQAARAQRPAQGEGRHARSSTDKFARTGYAPRGALVLAKMLFDSGDIAGAQAQLQWVIDRADEDELKEIARYRLAEILLNDKQYDEALKVLDAKHGDPFAGLYADLRGDALAAAGRTAEAQAAYQTALAKLDAEVAVPATTCR